MARLTEYKDMNPRAKAVVEGIATARGIDPATINNVWKALARHPAVMEAFAAEMKAAFAPGQARSAHQGISLSRGQHHQSVRILHRLARHDGAAEGHDRRDARGIHGRRPGRTEGQQDRHGLSRAGRRRSSRRSERERRRKSRLGRQSLSQVRRRAPAARARPDGPARSGQRRAAGPRDLRSRLRRRQHQPHPGRAFPGGAGHRHRFVGGDARQGAQPDGRQARHLHHRRPGALQARPAAVDPLQQRRLSMGRRPHRPVSRPAEASAVGRPARDPDAAQPRGAVACADARRRPRPGRGATSSPRWAASARCTSRDATTTR